MSAMTEEEARKKWCPASFAIPEQRSPSGDAGREGGPWMCVASKCMAWRWDPNSPERQFTIGPASDIHHLGAGWFGAGDQKDVPPGHLRYSRDNPDRRGYCGLAGAPTP